MSHAPKPLFDPLPKILTLGSLNLLAGASGVGKTALIAELARRFRDGDKVFGHASHVPPAIAYITADRPWVGSKYWFDLAGFPEITQYSVVDDRTVTPSTLKKKFQRVQLLIDSINRLKLPRGSLIFVDPIALFLGGDLNAYDTVAVACIELHRYCEEHDYCIVGIAHSSKQKADRGDRYARPQDRISGTMALLGYTGTQMYLMAPEEAGPKEKHYQFHWNPHYAPAQTFRLAKDDQGCFTGIGEGAPSDPDHDLHLTYDPETKRILASIPEAPSHISTAELIAFHCYGGDPIPRRTLFRKIALLAKRGDVVQVRKGAWQRAVAKPAN